MLFVLKHSTKKTTVSCYLVGGAKVTSCRLVHFNGNVKLVYWFVLGVIGINYVGMRIFHSE